MLSSLSTEYTGCPSSTATSKNNDSRCLPRKKWLAEVHFWLEVTIMRWWFEMFITRVKGFRMHGPLPRMLPIPIPVVFANVESRRLRTKQTIVTRDRRCFMLPLRVHPIYRAIYLQHSNNQGPGNICGTGDLQNTTNVRSMALNRGRVDTQPWFFQLFFSYFKL